MKHKSNLLGIVRNRHFLKIQIGWLRIYFSILPMKCIPKHVRMHHLRRELLERDNHRCQICGKHLTPSTLSIHHINPGLRNDPSNMQCLCDDCHHALHRNEEIKRTTNLIPVLTLC